MKVALAGLVALAALVVLVPVVVFAAVAGAIATPPSAPAALPGVPPGALAAYEQAVTLCSGLSWTVLAGIGEVESDHGRADLPGVRAGANRAGAEGPMQFLPRTFSAYAVPRADGSLPSPYDLGDAAAAAARLLCADGAADPARLPEAVFAYNHSAAYVTAVLGGPGATRRYRQRARPARAPTWWRPRRRGWWPPSGPSRSWARPTHGGRPDRRI